MPFSCIKSASSLESLLKEYSALALCFLSKNIIKQITNSKIEANCIAVIKSYMPNHVRNIPVVKVGIAKC